MEKTILLIGVVFGVFYLLANELLGDKKYITNLVKNITD